MSLKEKDCSSKQLSKSIFEINLKDNQIKYLKKDIEKKESMIESLKELIAQKDTLMKEVQEERNQAKEKLAKANKRVTGKVPLITERKELWD